MSAIWMDGKQDGSEAFLRARRAFDVECPEGAYVLCLSSSGRYRLWVNGVAVARGPAHSGVQVRRVDELDITKYLSAGRNVLAVQLIHFDYYTAQGTRREPAFECSLQGHGIGIQSDAEWTVSVDRAYKLPSFRRNNFYGPQEIYDAREEEPWQTLDYDDSGWPHAVEVTCPLEREIPRGVPFPREFDVRPVSVFRVAEVLDQEHFPEMWRHKSYQSLAVTLLQDIPEEPALTRVCGAESLLKESGGGMTVTQPFMDDPGQTDRYCATVLFDFGREITGYTWFEVEGNAGAMVDVVHGEVITAGRVQSMRQGTHYADRYILREGRQRHEIYDWKGFRYIQVTFRNLTREMSVYDLGVTFSSYPVDERGGVRCGDELLERIWQVGAYTQQLCMHDRLMDCPWREQAQWLGDGRIQLLIIQNAFGEKAICRKFVEDFAQSQSEDGLIPSLSGAGSCSPVQDIIDYALWWVVAVHDVVMFDQDASFAGAMLPHVERLLGYFRTYVNDEGLIDDIPGWVFIDWANLGREGCVAPLNGMYYMALQSAEALARMTGSGDLAESCRNAMRRIEENYHRVFWSEKQRFYRDCVPAVLGEHAFSQHTQVIAVLSGLSRVDARDLMERACEEKDLVQTSPFFSFYLLEALGRVGMGTEAAGFIRERWGAMLQAGATTFWEEWQTNGTYRDGCWAARPRSLCHAWSAAPTAWMSRYLLGIRQEELGGPLLFAPCVCGLTEAEGSVPTRYGIVRVAWRVTGGRFSAELTLPENCPDPVFIAPSGHEQKAACKISPASSLKKAQEEKCAG